MKVAPLAPPALAAVTVPSCISTMCLTMARPRPSPPALVSATDAWRKRSNTNGRTSAGIPEPESATVRTALGSRWSRRTTTRPPRGVNFKRVGQEVRDHLLQARGVAARSARREGRCRHLERDPVGGGRGPGRVHGRVDERGEVQGRPLQVELAGDDPGDVEEIGDERVLHVQVPLDRLHRPLHHRGVGLPFLEDVHPAHDRGQRASAARGRGWRRRCPSSARPPRGPPWRPTAPPRAPAAGCSRAPRPRRSRAGGAGSARGSRAR